MASATPPITETELRMPFDTLVFLWVTCTASGVGLGLVLPWLLRYVATWPLPYIDVLKLLGSFDTSMMMVGRPLVLGLGGLAVASAITYDSAQLRISDTRLMITEGEDTRMISREQVGGVFRCNEKVRIESPEGRVLFDGDVEGSKARTAEAFVRYHYPWESA